MRESENVVNIVIVIVPSSLLQQSLSPDNLWFCYDRKWQDKVNHSNSANTNFLSCHHVRQILLAGFEKFCPSPMDIL